MAQAFEKPTVPWSQKSWSSVCSRCRSAPYRPAIQGGGSHSTVLSACGHNGGVICAKKNWPRDTCNAYFMNARSQGLACGEPCGPSESDSRFGTRLQNDPPGQRCVGTRTSSVLPLSQAFSISFLLFSSLTKSKSRRRYVVSRTEMLLSPAHPCSSKNDSTENFGSSPCPLMAKRKTSQLASSVHGLVGYTHACMHACTGNVGGALPGARLTCFFFKAPDFSSLEKPQSRLKICHMTSQTNLHRLYHGTAQCCVPEQ